MCAVCYERLNYYCVTPFFPFGSFFSTARSPTVFIRFCRFRTLFIRIKEWEQQLSEHNTSTEVETIIIRKNRKIIYLRFVFSLFFSLSLCVWVVVSAVAAHISLFELYSLVLALSFSFCTLWLNFFSCHSTNHFLFLLIQHMRLKKTAGWDKCNLCVEN